MNKLLINFLLSLLLIFAVFSFSIPAYSDQVILDDLIVDGSACVGFDCVNGESFGFDTIILKENNLRILFNDTSVSASFPRNDWRLVANDSANGGGNYFAIQDATSGRYVFKVEAGAPSNALYVDDYGRVGFGTNSPVVELHIADGDTPTVRLDQDGSGGWAPQVWDMAGNEANFFIRDATNGSKLPFRIQPDTPSSTLSLKADGKVGIGTWSPEYALEVEKTGVASVIVAQRTDGAKCKIGATYSQGQFGTITDHPLKFVANNTTHMTLTSNGYLGIGINPPTHLIHLSGGAYSDGAVWTDSSSRELKESITELKTTDAITTLNGLTPVTYNYKTNKNEKYVGFIAEDVPELVATTDRKGMSSMDVVAVLTKVVQQQQETIKELKKRLERLEDYNMSQNSNQLLSYKNGGMRQLAIRQP